MDIPPVSCLTNDDLRVQIDVTLFYSVIDPVKAIYDQEDATYLLCENAMSAVRDVIAQAAGASLKGHDTGIAQLITVRLNERMGEGTGLRCDRVVMQEAVPRDKKILQDHEAMHRQAQAAKIKMAAEEQKGQLKSAAIKRDHAAAMEEQRCKEELAKAALGLAQRQVDAEVARKRAKVESEIQLEKQRRDAQNNAEAERIEALVAAGMSPENIVQLETARAMMTLAQSDKSTIFLPQSLMTAGLIPFNPPPPSPANNQE